MNAISSAGRWLLLLALLLGVLAMIGLTFVALAAEPEGFSITLPDPYAKVVDAVREVCGDGTIRGTSEYESETTLTGAGPAASSASFPRWAGSGDVFFKVRPKTVSPANFAGARDLGTVTVRYIVEPGPNAGVRVTIDAVFIEDNHHGRHASKGFVERAEFGAIAMSLKNRTAAVQSGPPGARPEQLHEVAGAAAPPPRIYPYAEQDLKRALKEMGAFNDAALPMLEGFAVLDPDQLARYDRPRYQFRVQFERGAAGRTAVRVEARISARYTADPASRPEYRSIPSNGRLESDLLDRLASYMEIRAATSAPDAGGVPDKIARSAGRQ